MLARLAAARGAKDVLLTISLDVTLEDMVSEILAVRDALGGIRLVFHPYPEPLFGAVGGRGVDGALEGSFQGLLVCAGLIRGHARLGAESLSNVIVVE